MRGWIGWAAGWLALMIALWAIGTAYWRDSTWWNLPLVLTPLGGGVIGYRRRHGSWPWERARLAREDRLTAGALGRQVAVGLVIAFAFVSVVGMLVISPFVIR